MTPLKITFNLRSQIVLQGMPLHLDSLLAYVATQDNLVTLPEDATRDDLLALADNLPLARHEQDGDWVYKASALIPTRKLTHSRLFYTQRLDLMDLSARMAKGDVKSSKKSFDDLKPHELKLDTARGAQRNLLGYFNVTATPSMTGYCIGDKEAIEEALVDSGHIRSLGPRRRQGYGAISSIIIEEDDDALTMWQHRVKPFAMSKDDEPIVAACRAPYWDKLNFQNAFIPASLL